MTAIRVGQAGLGEWGKNLARNFAELAELVWLTDPAEGKREEFTSRYPQARWASSFDELLADPELDAVVVATPVPTHYELAKQALEAGKHVFVEKPLAWNLREAREVAERARRSDRIVQLAYHKLYDPAFRYTKSHLEQMSDLAFARITVLHPDNQLGLSPYRIRRGGGAVDEGHIDPGTLEGQRTAQLRGVAAGNMEALVDEVLGERKGDERLRLAYGIIVQSLIHQIYMLYGFLGEPTRVVSTDVWRGGFSIHSVVEYPNDLRVTLDWHYLMNLKDYREEYAFFGNRERVTMQLPSPYFKNFPSPVIIQGGEDELAWEKRVTVSYEEAFRLELMAFYENVREHRKPFTSVDDALRHTAFAQQLIEAAR